MALHHHLEVEIHCLLKLLTHYHHQVFHMQLQLAFGFLHSHQHLNAECLDQVVLSPQQNIWAYNDRFWLK